MVFVQLKANNNADVMVNAKNFGTFAVTGNLTIRMGNASDTVTLDLNSFTLGGNVNINSGNGGDTVNIEDMTVGAATGAIGGSLAITTGTGADTVQFLAPPFPGNTKPTGFTVNGPTTINTGSASDTVLIEDGSGNSPPAIPFPHQFINFSGPVIISNANTVDIGTGSSSGPEFHSSVTINNTADGAQPNVFNYSFSSVTDGDLTYLGGLGSDTVTLKGIVTGNVNVNAGNGTNSLIVGGVIINGSLTYTGGAGADDFEINGTNAMAVQPVQFFPTPAEIDGNVTVNMGNGNNTYQLASGNGVTTFGYFIGGNLSITGGNGSDPLGTIGGPATAPGVSAQINGNIYMNLGNGASSVTLDGSPGAGIFNGAKVTYIGGSGADTVQVDGMNTFALSVSMGSGANTFTYGASSAVGSAYLDFGLGSAGDVYNDGGNTITWPQTIVNFNP
jgi:hypothetical protein